LSVAGVLPVGERTLVRAGGGALLDGKLRIPGGTGHTFDSGGLAFAGLERRTGEAAGWTPAIGLTLTLGFTWGQTTGSDTRRADYRAMDLRAGVRASWTVADRFYPYAAARVFGGPVNWEIAGDSVTGSDAHHYQLAVGAGLTLGPVVTFAEFAGAGETGARAGLGSNW
jgi:opacity protein-like surface antigen